MFSSLRVCGCERSRELSHWIIGNRPVFAEFSQNAFSRSEPVTHPKDSIAFSHSRCLNTACLARSKSSSLGFS